MWPELREEVELELAMLRQHLDTFKTLRESTQHREPDRIETMALAGMLHGFYNGVENIFKRAAVHCDGGPPRGDAWRQRLLTNMTKAGRRRPIVISESLRIALVGYLDFRHFFRQAYAFHIKWDKMASLVAHCEETLADLETELHAFLKAVECKE